MLRNTVTRLFTCHFAERYCRVSRGLCHRRANAIHFGLGGVQELSLCIARLHSKCSGFLNGKQIVVKFSHMKTLLSLSRRDTASGRCEGAVFATEESHTC